MSTKRIESFDIMKMISIFLVCFCHFPILSGSKADNFLMTICYVAVPIFFMINGALILNGSFDLKKHINRMLTIYISALFWRIFYLLSFVVSKESFSLIIDQKDEILSYIFFFSDLSMLDIGHMWFVKVLLSIYLIVPVLHACLNHSKWKEISIWLLSMLVIFSFVIPEIDIFIQIIKTKYEIDFNIKITYLSEYVPLKYGNSIFFYYIGAFIMKVLNEKSATNFWLKNLIRKKMTLLCLFAIAWIPVC